MRKRARELVQQAIKDAGQAVEGQGLNDAKSRYTPQYLFGRLSGKAIRRLVQLDDPLSKDVNHPKGQKRAIYRIWPDFRVNGLINRSVSTVKADAARASFGSLGEGIVWAVMDSGIDRTHPHFKKHSNLANEPPLEHRDFTVLENESERPCEDRFGHGTHVTGIIAGEMTASKRRPIRSVVRYRDENGKITYRREEWQAGSLSGMAPKCKLLSLKVLNDDGDGEASNLIAAIGYIQEVNGNGTRIRIHGVNMSVGYPFIPEWFACGQSPLCVEVDRLVRSGVVVVVAAGNHGYG